MDAFSTTTPDSGTGRLAGFTGLRYGELVERRAERQPSAPRSSTATSGSPTESSSKVSALPRPSWPNRGSRPGDRVVCYSENCPEILIALYASSRIGAVFAPVGVASPPEELSYVLQDFRRACCWCRRRPPPPHARCPALPGSRCSSRRGGHDLACRTCPRMLPAQRQNTTRAIRR